MRGKLCESLSPKRFIVLVAESVQASANTQTLSSLLNHQLAFGHIEKWRAALCLLFLVLSVSFIIAWKPWKQELRNEQRGSMPRLGRGLALAFWTTFMILCLSIWLDTVFHEEHENPYACLVPIFWAFCIFFFTFALEGLEVAYIELRDKDDQQFMRERRAIRVLRRIAQMRDRSHPVSKAGAALTDKDYLKARDKTANGEDFFEAREWAIIMLLIWATFLIDRPKYSIPWVIRVTEQQTGLLTAVRLTLTIGLTAFALVWVAQSPSKYVARNNSVNFLTSIPSQVGLLFLRFAWYLLSFVGLQYPSQITNKLAMRAMPSCQERRNLPPSEFTFFADALKKYGYGFLIGQTDLNICADGSCKVCSRTLFYIDMPRESVSKVFGYEAGFEEESQRKLDNLAPSKCWVFMSPLIGETVSQKDLETWEELFYFEGDRSGWKADGYTQLPADSFKIKTTLTLPSKDKDSELIAGDGRPLHTLMVELKFLRQLPPPHSNSPRETWNQPEAILNQNAVIVLWEVEITTKRGTVPLPASDTEKTQYPFYRRHSNPSLRDTIVLKLPNDGLIFVNPDHPDNFEVNYDGTTHTLETKRFELQVRDDLKKKAPQRGQSTDRLTNEAVLYVDSPLPAAIYSCTFHMERKLPKD